MPRIRTVALAMLVSVASLGLAAGIAWQWLLREALLVRAGRTPTWGAVLRPSGGELRAGLWGLAFLPIFWGGLLTFLSPALAAPMPAPDAAALLLPYAVAGVLVVWLRVLYRWAALPAGEIEPEPGGPADVARAAWRRHVTITLYCSVPGLLLCTLCMLSTSLQALGVFALLLVPPALVSPWIGALSALAVLARGGRPPSRVLRPAEPASRRQRLAVGTAGLALVATWLVGAHALLTGPAGSVLLEQDDFSAGSTCTPPSTWPLSGPSLGAPEDAVAWFTRAGLRCAPGSPGGAADLGDQVLAWCEMSDAPRERVEIIAVDRASARLRGTNWLDATSARPTASGVLGVTRAEGDLRVVRIGRDARIDAEWRAPGRPPVGASILSLPSAKGRVSFAWDDRPGRVGVVVLDSGLVPRARPTFVATTLRSSALTVGTHTCLTAYGDGPRTLVLDGRGAVWRPSSGERLSARGFETFLLGWTGLALGVLAAAILRASRTGRRFARSAARGDVCDGTLSPLEEGSAVLQRADGQVVRVKTHGAARHGFADVEPLDGPCVVVGVPGFAGAAAYRSAPPVLDAASGFGIVRGDLAGARDWATGQRDRVVTGAVVLGWLLCAPALLAVLVELLPGS